MQPKYLGLHCLRHFAISTWLRSCNGDFKLAQRWAGHATMAMTTDRYGHLLPRQDGHAIMNAIARATMAPQGAPAG
jgi:integrase